MDFQWDADFRDQGIFVRPKSENCRRRQSPEFIVPDLASLTDEEFSERIAKMKREHEKMLRVCDQLGFCPTVDVHLHPEPKIPTAKVNDSYILTTGSYCSPAGDLITSSYGDVRQPFKARRAPPRKKVTEEASPKRFGLRRKHISFGEDSPGDQDMKHYMMERYLNTCGECDENFNCVPKCGRPRTRSLSRNVCRDEDSGVDDQWHPRITVPKPFQMTVRESLKQNGMSRSMADFERRRQELANEEMIECSKKFKASPAPASIYVPLYEELGKERDRRRHQNVCRRQLELERLQKPFAFIRREEMRKAEKSFRDAAFADANLTIPDANFKAKPFPEHIYNNDAHEKRKWQEEKRQMQKLARAEAMLELSSLPPNMTKKRPSHNCGMSHDVNSSKFPSPSGGGNASRTDERIGSPVTCCYGNADCSSPWRHVDSTEKESKLLEDCRWPAHCVSGCPLSRSLTDLLSASSQCEQTDRRRHHSRNSIIPAVQKPSIKSTNQVAAVAQMSSAHSRPPRPRQSTAAETQVRKWRVAEFNLDERLRREIENDLKNIDLTTC